MKISDAMARRLLLKFSTGDFGAGQWSTVAALIKVGAVETSEDGKSLHVTPAGRQWCLDNHLRYNFLSNPS